MYAGLFQSRKLVLRVFGATVKKSRPRKRFSKAFLNLTYKTLLFRYISDQDSVTAHKQHVLINTPKKI